MNTLPDDLLIDAANEVLIRQDLVQVALGKRPADRLVRVGRLFDAGTRTWIDDAEIAFVDAALPMSGRREASRAKQRTRSTVPVSARCRGSARCTNISRVRT